jgi:hypothetical protein
MENAKRKLAAVVVRWVFLTPIIPMSAFMTMMGWVGLGFGAGIYVLALLLSFPAFLLNFISAKWGVIGASLILVLAYVPVAILNWPKVNPIVLMDSKSSGILALIFVLNLAAAIAPKIIGAGNGRNQLATPE